MIDKQVKITDEIKDIVVKFKEFLTTADKLFTRHQEGWEQYKEKASKIEKEILLEIGYKKEEIKNNLILFPYSDKFIVIRKRQYLQ